MFFDSADEIEKIASRVGCAIFVVPKNVDVEIKNALVLKPEEKTTITIDQVREMIQILSVKQIKEQFVVIRPADLLGEEAANAFLKNLEEPGEKVHFVLITDAPTRLLPTILSRAEVYYLRKKWSVDSGVEADDRVKELAKRLMVARPTDLPSLAEEICKKKENVRAFSLEVLGAAIEMLYKSYFITKKDVFLKKLPKFFLAYENIEKNGHIKLHLVADLI